MDMVQKDWVDPQYNFQGNNEKGRILQKYITVDIF